MWLLSYWLFPLIACVMWLAMLSAMFGYWEARGSPIYPSMNQDQTIAYISDVGAFKLKPLFITGNCVTSIFLDLAFIAERWLRHTGRLARNTGIFQKNLGICSIIAAIAGTAAIILLSIFDTYHHPRLHDYLLGLFIISYALSAIFLCTEYQRLGIHYRQHRVLRMSFWMKLSFILIEVALAVVFGVSGHLGHYNIAAVVEWVIALIFAFYIMSFVIDLLPSVRTKHHTPQGWKNTLKEQEAGMEHPTDYGVPLTHDSAGPNQSNYRGNLATNPNTTNAHAYATPARNY